MNRRLNVLIWSLLFAFLCMFGASAKEMPFTDVSEKNWYYDSVKYVYENGMMSGTDDDRFAPGETLTRAMFVTILGRLDGVKVDHTATTVFTDVAKNRYYTGYVKWGNENGIVKGTTTTTFSPNANITREQMCVLMVRYAEYAKVDLKASHQVVVFMDADKISSYAKTAVEICQQSGLVNGEKSGNGYNFRPKGNATRAQAAAIFERFDRLVKAQKVVCDHNDTKLVEEVAATCGKDGTGYMVCTKCGETVEDNVVLPATGNHNDTKLVTEVAATCGKDGTGYMACTKCDKKVEDVVLPATGNHVDTKLVTEVAATCGKDGTGYMACTKCDKKVEDVVLSATGNHASFSESTEIPPDVFTDGIKRFSCKEPTCNYSYVEPILATGSLNATDREKFAMALTAMRGTKFKGGELVKYLYFISFSITPAVSEDPDAVINQIFLDPNGTNSEKYVNTVVPRLYGGKAVTDEMEQRINKEKGNAVLLENMLEGDILCVLADADVADSARFYATDGTSLYDLTDGCKKLEDTTVLNNIANNDFFAVLRPSVVASAVAWTSLHAQPLCEGNTDVEKAIIATAESFLLRGDRMQYADTRLVESPSIYRWERGKAPEDYTTDETGYTNCTGFTHDVYLQALGFDYGSFKLADAPAEMKAYTYFFTGSETDQQKKDIEQEYKQALQIGDIVFYTYSGNTHAMLYVGNGNLMHSTGNTYDYEKFKEAEEPAIRFMSLDVLFDPANSSRYLFQTAKPRTALYIIRPLNQWEGGELPAASKARIGDMRGVFAEKTCSKTLGQTINPGDTLRYTFTIANTTDKMITIPVVDCIPDNTVLLENGSPVATKQLIWSVTLQKGEEKQLSYTVKVSETAADGSAITCSSESKVGNIPTCCPAVYVGRCLTSAEQQRLKTIVESKIGEEGTRVEMANEIYEELFGVKDILGADISALKDGVFVVDGSKRTIATQGKYAAMIAPSLYGGKSVINSTRFDGERTRLPREHNLMVGDILYLQGTSSSSGLYIYMGDGVMLDLAKGLTTRDIDDRLQNTIGWQHFAVLRPSLAIE